MAWSTDKHWQRSTANAVAPVAVVRGLSSCPSAPRGPIAAPAFDEQTTR